MEKVLANNIRQSRNSELIVHEIQVISTSNAGFPQSQAKTKLPKLELPNFEGDKTKWTSFWDPFKSAFPENTFSKVGIYPRS